MSRRKLLCEAHASISVPSTSEAAPSPCCCKPSCIPENPVGASATLAGGHSRVWRPAPVLPAGSAQSRPASHRRQLCYPQDPCGKALAQAAFALSLALYAHFGLVAQHGRAVLCRDHQKRIRRGVFKSVDELKQAIMDYLNHHNGSPKPYVWTKTAAEIFSKVARAKQALESQH
jgi:hypothetical protein